jgi:hypothetical protein
MPEHFSNKKADDTLIGGQKTLVNQLMLKKKRGIRLN